LAFAWGFAEATFFFVVPDVCLSFAALWNPRVALKASVAALAGALAGGSLMYAWGSHSPQTARLFLSHIPAIHLALISQVKEQLDCRGLVAILLGPLRGTPYKIYAVQWGAMHASFAGFLLISIPARYLRFLTSVLIVSAARRVARLCALAYAWATFYALYFWGLGW